MNLVILKGNLGADPEMRYNAQGTAICNMRIAVKEGKDKTGWHRLVCFEKTAEVAGQYLKKGSEVLVEGRLQNRDWEDKDGNKKYVTEVVVNRVHFVGKPQAQQQELPLPDNTGAEADVPF